MGSELKKTLWGVMWTAGQPLLLNAVSLPAMALIIRKLGPTAYGEWSVATSLIATLSFLANFGLRGAFIRNVARDSATAPNLFAEQLTLRFMMSVMTVGVALGMCWALGYSHVIVACTAVTGVGLVLGVVGGVAVDYLQAMQRLTSVAVVGLIAGLALTGVSVWAVWFGGGPVMVSCAYLVGPLISLVALMGWIARSDFPVRFVWDIPRFRELFRESRHFIAQQAIGILSTYAAALMLPKLIGTTEFGFYTAGTLLVSRLGVIPDALSAAFYPMIARVYHEDVWAAGRKALAYLGISVAASLPVACLVYASAGFVSHVLFPGREEQCRWIMELTIWALPPMALAYAIGYSLNAAGRDAEMTRLSFYYAVWQIVLTVVLIHYGRTAGACWTMVLRFVVPVGITLPLFFRTFPRILGKIGSRVSGKKDASGATGDGELALAGAAHRTKVPEAAPQGVT